MPKNKDITSVEEHFTERYGEPGSASRTEFERNAKAFLDEYSKTVRRKDRQETDTSFLHEILSNAVSCSIAIEKEGYPLIHVAFYHFDEANNDIIFHFSKHGHAGGEITNGRKASISVYKYGRLYTAAKAVDFGCEYQSVIIYGTIRIIEDEQERMRAMSDFFDRYFAHIPENTYEAFTSAQSKPIHVAKIRIERWFGKQHTVPAMAIDAFFPDFPAVMEPREEH
ncbi:Nitroimidazol reductase NimA, pyridoxamine 5'-phosphate oxidase superfamily [Dyadobacter soli]|uniref:Nitroimidazol reductase NimA, pyridoxamine 5'-phosphate oxidase superfamily n=1 Tax=Dyadobacter soli TaxID=659014 RepID=A0A1G7RVD7_9BACT|nr:pyridoxamine 5'-phosphate oxidase family protein [Dyadobacter soli]SDG14706.1 Nitroimidazol reductase NimA, pyridoxamine 5'-phosphate oxidase superfamily [Dyadobacter soli]